MASTSKSSPRTPHPSEGHSHKFTIGAVNPDEYLDKLKPKTSAPMTRQAMFDAAIRVLFKQGGPSIKVDEKGNRSITTFSTRKSTFFVSPVLAFLTPEDIRRLQKATDYHRLQTMKIWGLAQTSVQNKEDQELVKQYLEDRGVDAANWVFLQALETKHHEWAVKCLLVDDYAASRGAVMSTLYDTMISFCQAFALKNDVLNLFRPT